MLLNWTTTPVPPALFLHHISGIPHRVSIDEGHVCAPCSAFEADGTFCVAQCLPLVSVPCPVPMPALHTPVVGRDIWGRGGERVEGGQYQKKRKQEVGQMLSDSC